MYLGGGNGGLCVFRSYIAWFAAFHDAAVKKHPSVQRDRIGCGFAFSDNLTVVFLTFSAIEGLFCIIKRNLPHHGE